MTGDYSGVNEILSQRNTLTFLYLTPINNCLLFLFFKYIFRVGQRISGRFDQNRNRRL